MSALPTGVGQASRLSESATEERRGHRLAYRVAAVGIVLLAAFLRFYHLTGQPGLHFDEAANGFDILGVLKGDWPVFFTANRGREPLFIYWQSLSAALLGLSPFSLRLASAFVGTLSVAATAFAGSQLFHSTERPWRGRVVALAAAFLMATGYWPVAFSRIGLRANSFPLFEALAFGFLWRGLRRDRFRDFALAGLLLGAAMYTYFPSRLLPAVVGLLAVGALACRPSRRLLAQLATLALLWAATFLPLGAYYLGHSDASWSRIDEVSIFSNFDGSAHPLAAIGKALVDNSRMLAFDNGGAAAGVEGGRSMLDPVSCAFLWLGLALVVWRLARWRGAKGFEPLPYPFLVCWLGVMVSPSLLSIHAPQYLRLTGAEPAFALVMGVGVAWVWERLLKFGPRPAGRGYGPEGPEGHEGHDAFPPRLRGGLGWGSPSRSPAPPRFLASLGMTVRRSGTSVLVVHTPALQDGDCIPDQSVKVYEGGDRTAVAASAVVGLLLLASAGLNYQSYFREWLPSDSAYTGLMAEKVEAAQLISEWTRDHRVFLAYLYYSDYTVRLMAGDRWSEVQSFDAGAAAVIPSDRPTLYVFPAIDEAQPQDLLKRLGPAAKLEVVKGERGQPLLNVVSHEPKPAAESKPLATLLGLISLDRAEVGPSPVQPGAQVSVKLTWRALQQLPENYTVFVHLRDESSQTVAQQDGYPGHGSCPTLAWRPGDSIVDEYALQLPATVPPGKYHVVVGMYRRADLSRLELSVDGARAPGDEVTVGAVEVTR